MTGATMRLKVRSLVGLMPLLAVETIETRAPRSDAGVSGAAWTGSCANRPELAGLVSRWDEPGGGEQRLLALVHGQRMKHLLHRMLDPDEFLSDFGIRSISRYHRDHPYVFRRRRARSSRVDYEPAESSSGSVRRKLQLARADLDPGELPAYPGAATASTTTTATTFAIEYPTGSGTYLTPEAGRRRPVSPPRLASSFARRTARRPVYGAIEQVPDRPALARPRAVPRVLPRRHRARARRQPPDRLDSARRQSSPQRRALRCNDLKLQVATSATIPRPRSPGLGRSDVRSVAAVRE